MGVFKDAIDAITDITNATKDALKLTKSKKQFTSLHDRSMEGTIQFPHLVSRKLDIETAQMVCKASERALSNFVQISMSMSPNLYVRDGEDIVDYIRQFHTNIGTYRPGKLASNAFNALIESGYTGFIDQDMGKLVVTTVMNDTTTNLVVSNKEQLRSVLEDLNMNVLNKTVRAPKILHMPMKTLKEATPHEDLMHALRDNDPNIPDPSLMDRINIRKADLDYTINSDKFEYQREHDRVKDEMEREKNAIARDRVRAERNKADQTRRKDMDVDLNKNMLLDNDVKKSNELVSTLVHVRIQMISKDSGALLGIQDFVLGVKATMHPVASTEIIPNLVSAHRGNNAVFDFIRWSSGEISFAKDFLLNLSSIKQDVVNRSAGASPLWISAKRARNINKIYGKLGAKSGYPNMTIIVTRTEVDYIRDNYGIDFMNIRDVEKVIDTLYLIDFIVVDTAAQICHFKFEASGAWESVSFSGLEKENSRDERKFKEMLKALNRN